MAWRRALRLGDRLPLCRRGDRVARGRVDGGDITTLVDGGMLASTKGISAPGVDLPASVITRRMPMTCASACRSASISSP
jgi:hypothetical protein